MFVYLVALVNTVSQVWFVQNYLTPLPQFYFTDYFLNFQFLGYASQVLREGGSHQDRVFPKQTKCSIYR